MENQLAEYRVTLDCGTTKGYLSVTSRTPEAAIIAAEKETKRSAIGVELVQVWGVK